MSHRHASSSSSRYEGLSQRHCSSSRPEDASHRHASSSSRYDIPSTPLLEDAHTAGGDVASHGGSNRFRFTSPDGRGAMVHPEMVPPLQPPPQQRTFKKRRTACVGITVFGGIIVAALILVGVKEATKEKEVIKFHGQISGSNVTTVTDNSADLLPDLVEVSTMEEATDDDATEEASDAATEGDSSDVVETSTSNNSSDAEESQFGNEGLSEAETQSNTSDETSTADNANTSQTAEHEITGNSENTTTKAPHDSTLHEKMEKLRLLVPSCLALRETIASSNIGELAGSINCEQIEEIIEKYDPHENDTSNKNIEGVEANINTLIDLLNIALELNEENINEIFDENHGVDVNGTFIKMINTFDSAVSSLDSGTEGSESLSDIMTSLIDIGVSFKDEALLEVANYNASPMAKSGDSDERGKSKSSFAPASTGKTLAQSGESDDGGKSKRLMSFILAPTASTDETLGEMLKLKLNEPDNSVEEDSGVVKEGPRINANVSPMARLDEDSSKVSTDQSASSSSCESPTDFQCRDGQTCIEASEYCDSHTDCDDGSDEDDCSCVARLRGLEKEDQLCDGYDDCRHGEDEEECGCDSGEMFCGDGQCVDRSRWCDGVEDCSSGKDEVGCMILVGQDVALGTEGYWQNVASSCGVLVSQAETVSAETVWMPVLLGSSQANSESGLVKALAGAACEGIFNASASPAVSFVGFPPGYGGEFLTVAQDSQNENWLLQKGNVGETTAGEFLLIHVECGNIECPQARKKRGHADDVPNACLEFADGPQDEREECVERERLKNISPECYAHLTDGSLGQMRECIIAQGKGDYLLEVDERIVGGVAARPDNWPYIVSLQRNGAQICGATILNENWIITAAHCLDGYADHDWYFDIRAGMNRRQSQSAWEQVRGVDLIVLHEDYNLDGYMKHDLAVLRLSQPLYINRYVQPISLPRNEDNSPPPRSTCVTAGWGKLKEGGQKSFDLQEVDIPVLPKCKRSYNNDDIQICGGRPEGGQDSCQGDSGGPLFCKQEDTLSWYLGGVITHGIGCARENEPGVYVRVAVYLEWIATAISGTVVPEVYPLAACPGISCFLGSCVRYSWVCDGLVDCLDGADEANCVDFPNGTRLQVLPEKEAEVSDDGVVKTPVVVISETGTTTTGDTEEEGNTEEDSSQSGEDGGCVYDADGNCEVSAPAVEIEDEDNETEVALFDLNLNAKVCSSQGLLGIISQLVGWIDKSKETEENKTLMTLYQIMFARCMRHFSDSMDIE